MQIKKSQSSLEFLFIFGIAFALILLMSSLFWGFFQGEKSTLDKAHIENIGNRIISEVEKVYYLGNGNKKTINTDFPENIENISITHYNQSSLSFDVLKISYYGEGESYPLFFETQEAYVRFNCTSCHHNYTTNISTYNDTFDFTEGTKRIEIKSFGDYVSIDFIK